MRTHGGAAWPLIAAGAVALVILVIAATAATAATAAGAPAIAGSPPKAAVRARIEPESATVGDLVTVTLTAEGAPGGETPRIALPDWGERWGEAEIVSLEPVAVGAGGESGAIAVRLRAFRTGAVALPARPLSVRAGDLDSAAATPSGLALNLRSVLPPEASGQAEPKPPQPPVALPLGRRFWWTLAAAAATVLALAFALLLRHRRSQGRSAATRKAPLPELLRALAAIDPARVQEATTATSAALRVYLRDSLGIPAPERTTTEIRQAFDLHALETNLARGVLDLLRDLDGVKFASRAATSGEAAAWIAAARALAEAIAVAVAAEAAGQPERRAAA